jgi:hypothetical protein
MISCSLLALLGKVVDKGSINYHLLSETGVYACFLLSIQVFLVKIFNTVVETLSSSVKKVLGTRLEVDKVCVCSFHFVINYSLIVRSSIYLSQTVAMPKLLINKCFKK